MGFFRRSEEEDSEQAESRARVADGGIPLGAEERLKALASEGSLFTSGLSVSEFALLHRLGPRPLAQVMGASVVRTGWQYLPALEPGERQHRPVVRPHRRGQRPTERVHGGVDVPGPQLSVARGGCL